MFSGRDFVSESYIRSGFLSHGPVIDEMGRGGKDDGTMSTASQV
jgi:hypothetical protein